MRRVAGLAVIIAASAPAPRTAAAQAAPALTRVQAPAAFGSLDFSPQAVAWVSDTRLALTDISGHQVVIASLDQPVLRRIGREGGGPGEFRSPTFAVASPGAALVVDDLGARRISEFDSTFRFVRSAPTPGVTLRLLGWSGDRVRMVWISFTGEGAGPVVTDVNLATGTAADRFRVFARDSSVAVPAPGGMKGPNPFVSAAAGLGGEIVIGEPRTYRLVVFDSTGAVVRRFGRPDVPLVYRTPEEVAAMMAQARQTFAGRPVPPTALAQMEKSFREEPKPRIAGGIAVDGAGRVWVAVAAPGGRTALDAFSPGGRFLGSVTVAGRVTSIAARGSALAVVAERLAGDDEGAYGLDIYRIR
jgi:hypothetical protein